MTKKKQRVAISATAIMAITGLAAAQNPAKAALSAVLGGPRDPALFEVLDRMAAPGIEPIGANLGTITGGTNFATNNFMRGSGMEPGLLRQIVRVERSGPGWIEWDASDGGVHMWDLNASGFGDGAQVRFYRLVDAKGRPLSYGGGTSLDQAAEAEGVILVKETTVPAGGWVSQGSEGTTNRVYLTDKKFTAAYGDHAFITIKKTVLKKSEVHPRLYQWYQDRNNIFWLPDGAKAELVKHPGTIPASFADPGETCLLIDLPKGSGGWIGQYLFHALDEGEGSWYGQLEPGAPYKASVWLRQEGLEGGRVRFACAGDYEPASQERPWSVTGEWRLYTYEFKGPAYPTGEWHSGFGLEAQGPGRLWIDNFVVYRNDAAHGYKPFTPNRVSLDELLASLPAEGKKPAIRYYPLTYAGHSTVAAILSNYPNSKIDHINNISPPDAAATIPQALAYSLATGSGPADRAPPWITISEEMTESEWAAILEYLAAPYDPARDSPATKPWAALRASQHGVNRPWTEEFREIILEFGNETWHQGAGGYGWHGYGRPFWVHTGGREYGLFARYFIDRAIERSPWWKASGAAGKIRFALNANYSADPDSYGELAAAAFAGRSGLGDLRLSIGHANYVGAKWETGETPHAAFDAHGLQETLIAGWTDMFDLIDQAARTRGESQAGGGAFYGILAYEGGPSGYYVPGQGTDQQVAISELYGKSLAAAVSALDTWLYSSLRGYGQQEFFAFGSGGGWSSHTMPGMGGFRAQPGWLALVMRNRYAPGDAMLEVQARRLPSYSRAGERIPLISCYAIKGEGTLSVFILSRALAGKHDGTDFSGGALPVEVSLPWKNFASIKRFALTAPDSSPADPAANNLKGEKVAITALDIDPRECASGRLKVGPGSGGIAGGMPPGTAYLYHFRLR